HGGGQRSCRPLADSRAFLCNLFPFHPASACQDCSRLADLSQNSGHHRRLTMRPSARSVLSLLLLFLVTGLPWAVQAQTNSGTVSGSVTDPTGAVVPGAVVTIENPVSGYSRRAVSDSSGSFRFTNLPFNPYPLTVSANGFGSAAQDADVRSVIPINVN